MKQPGFLFVEDEQEYVEDRGELMFQLEELPFPVAYDMDELGRQIADFDQSRYEERVERFMGGIGVFEDGNASSRVVDFMEERMLHTGKGIKKHGGQETENTAFSDQKFQGRRY